MVYWVATVAVAMASSSAAMKAEPVPPVSALLASSSIPATLHLAYGVAVPVVLSLHDDVSSICPTQLLLYLITSYALSHLLLLLCFSTALHPLPLLPSFSHHPSIPLLSLLTLLLLLTASLTHSLLFLILPTYFPSLPLPPSFPSPSCPPSSPSPPSLPFYLALTGSAIQLLTLLWALTTSLTSHLLLSHHLTSPLLTLHSAHLTSAIAAAHVRHSQWLLEEKAGEGGRGEEGAGKDYPPAPPRRVVRRPSRSKAAVRRPPVAVVAEGEDEIPGYVRRVQEERRAGRRDGHGDKEQEEEKEEKEEEEKKEGGEEQPRSRSTPRPTVTPRRVEAVEEEAEEKEEEAGEEEEVEEAEEEKQGEEEEEEEHCSEDDASGSEGEEEDDDEEEEEEEDVSEAGEEEVEEHDDGKVPRLPLSARTIPLLPPIPARSAPRGAAPPLLPPPRALLATNPSPPPPPPAYAIPAQPNPATTTTPPPSASPAPHPPPTNPHPPPFTLPPAFSTPTEPPPYPPTPPSPVKQAEPLLPHPPSPTLPTPLSTVLVPMEATEASVAVQAAPAERRRSEKGEGRRGSGKERADAVLPILAVSGVRRKAQLAPLLDLSSLPSRPRVDQLTPPVVAAAVEEEEASTAPSPLPSPSPLLAASLTPLAVAAPPLADIDAAAVPCAISAAETPHTTSEPIVMSTGEAGKRVHEAQKASRTDGEEPGMTPVESAGDAVKAGAEEVAVEEKEEERSEAQPAVEPEEDHSRQKAESGHSVHAAEMQFAGVTTEAVAPVQPLAAAEAESTESTDSVHSSSATDEAAAQLNATTVAVALAGQQHEVTMKMVQPTQGKDAGPAESVSAAGSTPPAQLHHEVEEVEMQLPSPSTPPEIPDPSTSMPNPSTGEVRLTEEAAAVGWEEDIARDAQVHQPPSDAGGDAKHESHPSPSEPFIAEPVQPQPSSSSSSFSILKVLPLSQRSEVEQQLVQELRHEQQRRLESTAEQRPAVEEHARGVEQATAKEAAAQQESEEMASLRPLSAHAQREGEVMEEEVDFSEEEGTASPPLRQEVDVREEDQAAVVSLPIPPAHADVAVDEDSEEPFAL